MTPEDRHFIAQLLSQILGAISVLHERVAALETYPPEKHEQFYKQLESRLEVIAAWRQSQAEETKP